MYRWDACLGNILENKTNTFYLGIYQKYDVSRDMMLYFLPKSGTVFVVILESER